MPDTTLTSFVAEKKSKYTNELIFIPGEFTLSNGESLPYYAAVMPLEDLVKQIMLVEDLPQEVLLDWSLEELFQRDISWDRVNSDLVDRYLNDQDKLSFFNSLTIALLPKRGLTIEESYGEPDSEFEGREEGWDRIDVGNICIQFLTGQDLGVIQWNVDRIFPVAIDGQHRLAALKEYYDRRKKNLTLDSPELKTKISLILLILDKRVGFRRSTDITLIETLREIFIDLNKNARTVPKSRRILLEDQNIQSLCVRTLLAKKAKEYTGNELPLSIVTWREDEPKIDSGHSITSVLNLDEIINHFFDRSSIDNIDTLDRNEIKKYVDTILGKLEMNEEMNEKINERINWCVGRIVPFSFEKEHRDSIEEAFLEQWKPHIVRIFHEFSPYKEYITTAQDIGAIDGALADYLFLSEEKRPEHIQQMNINDSKFNPDSEIHEPLRVLYSLKANKWAFQVVFQKALFINLFILDSQRDSLFNLLTFDSRFEYVNWWISQVNTLHDAGVFHLDWKAEKGKPDLWVGIANTLGTGTIQYTLTAVNRISSFITICMYFTCVQTQLELGKFVENLISIDDSIPTIVRNAFKQVRAGILRMIKQKANLDGKEIIDENEENKRIKQEIMKRLKPIFTNN